MAVMTKKGAREVTQTLDRIANLFQSEAKLLGVPTKIATDFALRCDLLADHIERTASANEASLAKRADYYKGKNETGLSVEPPPSDGFDANNIGDEVPGPLEMVDSHEPWMKGEFTQEELNALRTLQQGGKLGPNVANGLHTKSASNKKSEEMPEEGKKSEEMKEEGKEAKKLAKLLLKLSKAMKADDDDDDDDDDEGEDKPFPPKAEGEGEAKKASLNHGFNLTSK